MAKVNAAQNTPHPNIFYRIGRYFAQLNFYSDEASLSITEQFIATRLNLSFLLICLFILTLMRGLTPQAQLITITSPSVSQFEQLINQYPSTLSCPCSQVLIPHNTFLSFSPQYHQVCSSEFISQAWISSLFFLDANQFHPLDFRISASSQFQVLELLCRTTSTTISNTLIEFGMQKLFSTQALSRATFDAQVEALVQSLQKTTTANVLRTDRLLALNIVYNSIQSSLRTNYYVTSKPSSGFFATYTGYYLSLDYKNMYDSNDYCSCRDTYDCSSQSGFYETTVRWSNDFHPLPPPLYSVPGIFSGCLPRFSLSRSTLECFYDSMCLNILASLGVDTSSRRPLDISIPSRFSINTAIESMFNELFIEEWHDTSNFSGYFRTCAPILCSYIYIERLDIIYIIIGILSLLGGLMMACELLAFVIVKYFLRPIFKKYCRHISVGQDEEPRNVIGFRQTAVHFIEQCRDNLLTLNIYERSAMLSDLQQKLWATRICFILLLIGVVILTIYSSVTSHSKSVTIHNPSRIHFEDLHARYPMTLSCPCSQPSTPYSTIINIQPRFHQICTSDFIREDKWLQYFTMIRYPNASQSHSFFNLDFRLNAGPSLFRIMGILCQFANETITNALIIFNNTPFVSNEPLSDENFAAQTSSLIADFEQQVRQELLSHLRSSFLFRRWDHFFLYSYSFVPQSKIISFMWQSRQILMSETTI